MCSVPPSVPRVLHPSSVSSVGLPVQFAVCAVESADLSCDWDSAGD